MIHLPKNSVQVKVSLPKELWEHVTNIYPKYGYRYPSWMLRDMLIDAFKMDKWNSPETNDLIDKLEKEKRIGELAEIGRARKFAIAFAVKDLEEEIRGYKLLYERGDIPREVYEELVKEAEERHKKLLGQSYKRDTESNPSQK